jgi:phosphoglycerate dehydrogenase-like enzyme
VTNQRLRRWEQIFTDPVAGKTVVVIGMGRIGGEAARRAKQLGMRVIGVRRSGARHRDVDRMYRVEALAKALPQADFVLVAAPLTAETRGLIGRRELDLLKPAAGLVNMGRAGIVDYEALAAKLERRELAGAVLDVFHPEPLPSRTALWRCPNLIITPHVSSDALDYMSHVLRIFATNVGRYLSGRPLKNAVSRQDQY